MCIESVDDDEVSSNDLSRYEELRVDLNCNEHCRDGWLGTL